MYSISAVTAAPSLPSRYRTADMESYLKNGKDRIKTKNTTDKRHKENDKGEKKTTQNPPLRCKDLGTNVT